MSIEIIKVCYSGTGNIYYIKDTLHTDIGYIKNELIAKFNKLYLDEIRNYLLVFQFHDMDEEVLFLLEYGSKYKFNQTFLD